MTVAKMNDEGRYCEVVKTTVEMKSEAAKVRVVAQFKMRLR